jgi:RND family efflux transporter MFP subunit
VLVLAGRPEPSVVARWPAGDADSADLVSTANAAVTGRKVVTTAQAPSATSPTGGCQVAIPISIHLRVGAVAVEVEDAKASEVGSVADLLKLGTCWLEALLEHEAATAQLVTAVELVEISLEQRRFQAGATAVATELATRLGCERVSIGMMRRTGIRVEALSHSAHFDARVQLIQGLAAAMDEAVDQDATVVYPPLPEAPTRITREHKALTQQDDISAALTVPLASEGKIVGAITFERRLHKRPFDVATFQLCEDVAALLGPALVLQRKAGASPLERCRMFVAARWAELSEPGRATPKLVAAMLLIVLAFLVFARGDYRLTAEARLEGRVQRVIVAGLDGYIAEANARAGDIVSEGQVLGRLDDRDLLLERRKWTGRGDQLRKEYREALAAHDRAQVNIISARIAQARAQLELLEENLLHTRLIAPFDGIVVQGDLSQSMGSPIERGDVLFEVAPLDGFRIVLEVDERDIANAVVGQRGRLTLSALPGQPLPLVVERITPVATAEDGRNFFRVDAQLEEPTPSLRPGMEGVAKIEVGRRRLIWIWTHSMIDWLRLWVWTWLL